MRMERYPREEASRLSHAEELWSVVSFVAEIHLPPPPRRPLPSFREQVIGRPLGEGAMLRVAHALEGQLNFASQVPDRVREARS